MHECLSTFTLYINLHRPIHTINLCFRVKDISSEILFFMLNGELFPLHAMLAQTLALYFSDPHCPKQTKPIVSWELNDLKEGSKGFCHPAASDSQPGLGQHHQELGLLFWQEGCQVINYWVRLIVSGLFIHSIFSSASHCSTVVPRWLFMLGLGILHSRLLSTTTTKRKCLDLTVVSAKTTHSIVHYDQTLCIPNMSLFALVSHIFIASIIQLYPFKIIEKRNSDHLTICQNMTDNLEPITLHNLLTLLLVINGVGNSLNFRQAFVATSRTISSCQFR